MKSNFFKIVLPAFALMIAITASLAFTPNSEDDVTVTQAWFENSSSVCTLISPIECETEESTVLCTAIIEGEGPNAKQLYRVGFGVTPCTVLLYKEVE